ncbi:Z1 domain-containing protein [Cryobacterium sp. PH31-L1]|uniref:Z1 domain-containing protein n=1 Tax=Cryobacterium sp. PH31-L1 TaxID=3046199 RepID=UPI0024B8FC06|nr:Z1 domain-containing protein [Cryobacterium sp. PH31-L1]MDJ0378492.1 Z1 domain-containing protein [Cryobacterium sp. PH31-L1]
MTTTEIPAAVSTAIRGALQGMNHSGPEGLLDTVNLKLKRSGVTLSETELIDAIVATGVNDPARTSTHIALARWDAEPEADWIDGTQAGTLPRRTRTLDLLELGEQSRPRLDEAFPRLAQQDIVISGPWDAWYTAQRRQEHDFYWKAYRGVLEGKGWDPTAIAAVDVSTTNIISRLADPAVKKAYQSKGLVVGYVQSGKTANFTGIVAKAIDSGYRLIIVLTGTVELLRAQTQRRLDMELIGEENILEGRDPSNPDLIKGVDYVSTGDQDWIDGKFLRHGVPIIELDDVPLIKRLTTMSGDYKLLKAGIDAIDFRRAGALKDRTKPVNDPVNLYSSDVRIAVVKKNPAALKKLLADLKAARADLGEIPTLIIDDEADQASVNTINPNRQHLAEEDKKRTAINGLISKMLEQLKRAQYIGYTATPFANVFITPDDSKDIFPKDFIISLEPSPSYMGGKSFHDINGLPSDEAITATNSNEKAFVRNLLCDDGEGELREIRDALDAFVLSGAIKLWRQIKDPALRFRHHTMLVHESVKQDEHSELANKIRSVWMHADYSSPAGLDRLEELFLTDFLPVHQARDTWGTEMPVTFGDLMRPIGRAVDLVTASGDPVVVVNGSKDSDYKAVDFQRGPYWRIMVGGAKLSRGFTVEDLTISYYRRRAGAADTLMQMGRWFGYRPGYKDLVRLYIARDAKDTRGKTYDLYEAFTSIIEDEEAFRDQLRSFAILDEDGRPQVLPIDVPPMVYQQLPWLKPTGANKMYNAVLDFEGDGGKFKEFLRQPDRGKGATNEAHFAAVRDWVSALGELQTFEYKEGQPAKTKSFQARVAIVPAHDLYTQLKKFQWTVNYSLEPTLRFMKNAIDKGELVDWAVMVPYLADAPIRNVDGIDVPLLTRTRRQDRPGFTGFSFRQRSAIMRMAGSPYEHGGPAADAHHTPTRGALLLNFSADPDEKDPKGRKATDPGWEGPTESPDVATIFALAMPYMSAPRGRMGFRVRDDSQPDKPILNEEDLKKLGITGDE